MTKESLINQYTFTIVSFDNQCTNRPENVNPGTHTHSHFHNVSPDKKIMSRSTNKDGDFTQL